eukprot:5992524-Alexandrium_andersonii.AAC.1
MHGARRGGPGPRPVGGETHACVRTAGPSAGRRASESWALPDGVRAAGPARNSSSAPAMLAALAP